MTANIQVSKKLDDGTILVLGGEDYGQFLTVSSAVLGDDNAKSLADSFLSLVPASAGAPQAPTVQQVQSQFAGSQPAPQQQYTPAPQAAPAGAPGPAPIGSNGRPQKWVPAGVSKKTGRPYNGFFADDNPRY